MNIKVKNVAVPAFVALSLLFGACTDQTIESPDAVDGAVQEGVEGIEQGIEDAGNTVEDGAKNLQKGAEDAAGAAKDSLNKGLEDAGNAVEGLGEEAAE